MGSRPLLARHALAHLCVRALMVGVLFPVAADRRAPTWTPGRSALPCQAPRCGWPLGSPAVSPPPSPPLYLFPATPPGNAPIRRPSSRRGRSPRSGQCAVTCPSLSWLRTAQCVNSTRVLVWREARGVKASSRSRAPLEAGGGVEFELTEWTGKALQGRPSTGFRARGAHERPSERAASPESQPVSCSPL